MLDQLIDYSTAKLAKEKGFIADRRHIDDYYFVTKNLKILEFKEGDIDQVSLDESCCDTEHVKPKYRLFAATQVELQKWLREKHDIIVYNLPSIDDRNKWYCEVLAKGSTYIQTSEFNSYEEALEAGLITGLNLIK